jgi:hypothetical protein
LAAWLISSPATLGYGDVRIARSDFISACAVIVFAALSASGKRWWPRWAIAFVGAWLLFAPLVFWSASAAAYNNDTLVGIGLIVFSVVVPGVPGMRETGGPETPPGWSYNPSGWIQRAPVIALALIGFFIARYMAAFQLGHVRSVWDPFFGDGTARVLESDVSRAFPISDAGLGAISYLIEALTGFMGGTARWRTMPWLVLLFGFLVVPLGVVSIVLITLQPLAVGAWCTLCLATAVAMLIMISPAADEIVATVQFLAQARRSGSSLWKTLWAGGTLALLEPRTVELRPGGWILEIARASGLVRIPWNLALASALGVWIMFTPPIFGLQGRAANGHYVLGALVITFAVIAWGEIMRTVRWLVMALGTGAVILPWLTGNAVSALIYNDVGAGIALMALSYPKGRIEERFGAFDRWIV